MPDFEDWIKAKQIHVDVVADDFLPAQDEIPSKLHEAMRYSVIGGGKRVRPLLVYAASEVTEADPACADLAALAVECVHSYSLVHDDLPCMDNDMLRHGKPTAHAKYGEAMAMLAGDALQPEAFLLLAKMNLPDAQRLSLMRILAEAASTNGMCGGQAIDLENVGKKMDLASLQRMHSMKTGALLKASVLMGAWSGQAKFISSDLICALSRYGQAIGLAFQIVDDILDVTEDTQTLGKTAGKDAKDDKPTYVSIFGLHKAKEMADEQYRNAIAALEILPYGLRQKTRRLSKIAEYVVKRTY